MEIIDLPLLAQLHKNVLVKVLKGVFYFVRARQGVPRTTLLQRALVHVLWFDVEQREDKNNKNKNKGIAERCVSTQLVTLAFFLTVGGDLQSWGHSRTGTRGAYLEEHCGGVRGGVVGPRTSLAVTARPNLEVELDMEMDGVEQDKSEKTRRTGLSVLEGGIRRRGDGGEVKSKGNRKSAQGWNRTLDLPGS